MGVSGWNQVECRFLSESVVMDVARALESFRESPLRLDPLNEYLASRGLGKPIRGGEYGRTPSQGVWVEQVDPRTIRYGAYDDRAHDIDDLFDELSSAFLQLGVEHFYEVRESESDFVCFYSRNQSGQANNYTTNYGEGRLDKQLFDIVRREEGWSLDDFLEIEEFRDPSKRPDDAVEVLAADAPFEGLPKSGKTAVRVSVLRDRWFYGFVDGGGQIIAEPIYPGALPFSEGLAAIKGDTGFEYIDRAGCRAFDGEERGWGVKVVPD